ncbi:tRNA (N6-threonylcarbamoyladenosine(37)-N6)-methyltransferase TrmO [Bengtsoniella intestinalis]|uniref:tRNA (N6-threonylcarbamoyladenosine(37)-N6)-methyltransferase TrmO n=1 Tax=Bengtsoniella intestinalis TaxID=3073143 RepID=UPI00391F09F9
MNHPDIPMHIIATIHTDFPSKFGIPRQSGLVPSLKATIVFEPAYRNGDALRGLEDFSHLWLIWHFSKAERDTWSPTVRPPRLGGNARMGVFATRSPFRPNAMGLSCVKLEAVRHDATLGWVIDVSGADLMDGTPIFDIKPYLPYADCQDEAVGGFATSAPSASLTVTFADGVIVPENNRQALADVLAQDPRPRYQDDPTRVYGFTFAHLEVKFTVDGDILTVIDIADAE